MGSSRVSLVSTHGLAAVEIRVNTGVELVQHIALVRACGVWCGATEVAGAVSSVSSIACGAGGAGSARGGTAIGGTVVAVGVVAWVSLVGDVGVVRAVVGGAGSMGSAVAAGGASSTVSISTVGVGTVCSTVVKVRVDAGIDLVGRVGVVRTVVGRPSVSSVRPSTCVGTVSTVSTGSTVGGGSISSTIVKIGIYTGIDLVGRI